MRHVSEDLAEHLIAAGWKVITVSEKPGKLERTIDMASTVWSRRHAYDIAHVEVYSGLAFGWAELVCRMLYMMGKPFLISLHGGNLPEFARKWPGRVGWVLNHAMVVTTPSRYLLERLSHIRKDIALIPNPINLGAYEYRKRSVLSPSLAWLRSFHNIYNPSLAARAIAILKPDYPDIKLTMIGPDKKDGSLDQFRQVAAELGVTSNIVITGSVSKDKISDHLNTADIFINTTNFDNAPVSVMEAMACGLCIVSTNVGGLPFLLEHEVDALLVPKDDPEAMAAAIRRLLDDPQLAAALSENAYIKSRQWDWAAVLPQWEALFKIK